MLYIYQSWQVEKLYR